MLYVNSTEEKKPTMHSGAPSPSMPLEVVALKLPGVSCWTVALTGIV